MNKSKVNQVYLGLGSNLGDRQHNITAATLQLKNFSTIKRSSQIYETEPWGFQDQPKFLNQAILVETALEPLNLLQCLKEIEHNMGRIASRKNGPRLIDLDILFYNDLVFKRPELTIPHPHLSERAFMLVPLAEIAPNLLYPKQHKTIVELLQSVDRHGVSVFHE
jgi:2-amino-4-hydroxy-6-hydroxymethyldihydropteridine diphosphokinase